jgi:uncharacterized coiled-coil protein SlyX
VNVLNERQFDAMQAVNSCEAQIAQKRKELSQLRRHLRRARNRLKVEITADPAEWYARPNQFPYIEAEAVEG